MVNVLNKVFILTALGITSTVAAQQQAVPAETDPVSLFNEICYTQVPAVENIQAMAEGFAWVAMPEERLESFTTIQNPDLLQGWDIPISERIFRVVIVQSKPTTSMVETFPDMAEGTVTNCTMVLDGQDDAELIYDRLNDLFKKAPGSEDVPEGDLLTTTWSGGNSSTKVIVVYKVDADNRANLINLTLINK